MPYNYFHGVSVWALSSIFLVGAAAAQDPPNGATLPSEPPNPAVIAIQQSNPNTPADIAQAAKIMMNLGRDDLAKQYIQQLLQRNLSTKTLAALHRRFGAGLFIRMGLEAELDPEGAQLADVVLEAAQRHARDPERIQDLISALLDPSPETRLLAANDLREAGTAAINPLLRILADPRQAHHHSAARRAISSLGATAVNPLIGVMETSDTALRAIVIRSLGDLGDRRAISYLLGPALATDIDLKVQAAARQALVKIVGLLPKRWEAERLLARRLRRERSDAIPASANAENRVERWHWNDASDELSVEKLDRRLAASFEVARIARDLWELFPSRAEYRRTYLASQLAAAKMRGGLDQPLAEEALQLGTTAGVSDIEAVLEESLRADAVAPAIAAIEILGRIGSEDLLRSATAGPRPLASALKHHNRRVRFGAAAALMHIDPVNPFPGSSWLIETLAHLSRASGYRRALVVFPRYKRGSDIAGMLEHYGFAVDLVTNGRQLFRHAVQSSDYQILLVSDATIGPSASELIQSLRHEPSTATLPVGLLARLGNLEHVRAVATEDPLTIGFTEPYALDTMQSYIQRLLSLSPRDFIPVEERMMHAQQSLAWLTHIVAHRARYGFYDVLCWQAQIEQALEVPELAAKAAHLLGLLGSPASQRALVGMASQRARPLEERRSAAEALRAAVGQHGILLTTDEILLQYDRYNQSRDLDKETQKVLGSILDTLEFRHRAKRES